MSSLEPVVVAGAVVKAAAKAEQGDPKEHEVLRELAKETGALDPAVRAYAKRLAVKEQIRLKIWQPLGMLFGISRDYFENDFADDMADRVAQIPEEHLITPRLSVAGPTVQGIAFTVDEPELRAMYLNLLAAASDDRRASTAHPSFPEIIRQLSPEEAVLLNSVLPVDMHAIVELRSKVATAAEPSLQGYNTLATYLMNWRVGGDAAFLPERALQVVNWVRLGLVTVDYLTSLTDEAHYEWVETNPRLLALRAALDTGEFKRVEVRRGLLEVTAFGQAFHAAVMPPADVQPVA